MAVIEVGQTMDATLAKVWEELAALDRHPEWMADAEGISFRDAQRRGVGTTMEVVTRVGPFRTRDVMVVDRWEEMRAIGVSHRGLITGSGVFTLRSDGERTAVTWREHLVFPWYLGGPLGAAAARPVLRRIWRANLRRLAARLV